MQARAFLVLTLLSAAVLAACGGGGGTHTAPMAPVFTSTPGSAAAQDVAYNYPISATDPSGGSVTFTLTTGPTGAALSSNTLNWTPAASQSRLPNSFTVTATTSEGGSATQSWSVSPTGTVTVNTVDTSWTPSGPVTHAASMPTEDAVLLNSDGSVTVLPGSETSPGVFSIPNVPAGYYWLVLGLNTNQLFDAYWTNSSTFDAGRDIAGSPVPLNTSPQTTTFNFNLSGLDGDSPADEVFFLTDGVIIPPIGLAPASGSTSLAATYSTTTSPQDNIDWSQISTGFLLQYEPATLGPLNGLVLGPQLTMTELSLTDGAANSITQTLQPSPQASLNLSVPGSQWAPLFENAGGSTVTPMNSWLSVAAEPYVSGLNAPPNLFGPNLYLAMPPLLPGLSSESPWPVGACGAVFAPLPSNQPTILTDQNLGTLQYGDPFPSSWTRSVAFCQQGSVMIPVSGSVSSSFPFFFDDGEALAPTGAPLSLAPVVSQVQNPTINSASAFTAGTMNTTSVTLSWSAPATGAPYGYAVEPWVVIPMAHGVEFASAGIFATGQTSVTLPPLTAGNTYIFLITAVADGTAKVETAPNRSSLPTGSATVVSAPITISSGASGAGIHGDASLIKRLSQPGPGHGMFQRSPAQK